MLIGSRLLSWIGIRPALPDSVKQSIYECGFDTEKFELLMDKQKMRARKSGKFFRITESPQISSSFEEDHLWGILLFVLNST